MRVPARTALAAMLLLALPGSADQLKRGPAVDVYRLAFGVEQLDSPDNGNCFVVGRGGIATVGCGDFQTGTASRHAFSEPPTLGTMTCVLDVNVQSAASETVSITPVWSDGTEQADGPTALTFAADTPVDGTVWSGNFSDTSPYNVGSFTLRVDFSNAATAFDAAVTCVLEVSY